ncbi:hypothetical protein BpHYR1_051934 [Brachionus plicatilis]|uniref:Uncharacterized protein n=1 Tax=Brachionus plicatilis TaxID=10195 RepID=A0A3M7SH78_BRAPC|nr:hypothetical protein BpHYR1_051934 [Brachionus plicatilis]
MPVPRKTKVSLKNTILEEEGDDLFFNFYKDDDDDEFTSSGQRKTNISNTRKEKELFVSLISQRTVRCSVKAEKNSVWSVPFQVSLFYRN